MQGSRRPVHPPCQSGTIDRIPAPNFRYGYQRRQRGIQVSHAGGSLGLSIHQVGITDVQAHSLVAFLGSIDSQS